MKAQLKLTLNMRSYLVVGLGTLLLANTSAWAQTKEEVVKAWQQQIASLDSLQLEYEMTLKRGYETEPFRANEPLTWKYKFAISGDKYSINVVLPTPSKEIYAMGHSYNGDYYMGLDHSGGRLTVSKWLKDKNHPSPYLGGHPITAQYLFAFVPDTPETIKILKDPATWEQVTERITDVRSQSRDGRQSVIVTVGIPRSKRTYEVTVDEKTLLPDKWSKLASDGELVNSMEIKTFTARGKEGSPFLFPSEIIMTGFRNGKAVEEGLFKTNPESLKINEPIPQEVYNLAPPNTEVVDEDEQERLFLEREKKQKDRTP